MRHKHRNESYVSDSLGVSDAGRIPMLNASGLIDPSMLPLSGTAWPASPADGQLFFRSDLADPELFFWSASLSKWLSVVKREFMFVGLSLASGAQWLHIPGAGATSGGTPDFGYRANYPLIVTAASFSASANASTSYNFVLQKNGLNLPVGVNHSTSASDGYSTGFSSTFADGDIIGAKATNTMTTSVVFTAYMHRYST